MKTPGRLRRAVWADVRRSAAAGRRVGHVAAAGLWVLMVGVVLGGPTARAEGGATFRDCDDCPLMTRIPGGTFAMGSPEDERGRRKYEGPRREVAIRPFALGVYEVTFAEWDACVADGGCGGYSPKDEGWGRGDRPVIRVSWRDAQAYVEWLNAKTGGGYRLASEAEWEYAARAGSQTLYWMGDQISRRQANFDSGTLDSDGAERLKTLPVGSFRANPFGVHDVHGNVSEWVQDCFHSRFHRAPQDGSAWMEGENGDCTNAVIRGGSWSNFARAVRSASRQWFVRNIRLKLIGFRVAKTLPE